MRRTAVRVLGVILVGLLAAVVSVAAQDKPAAAAADPSGTWDGTVETPNGVVTFALVVKIEKDKVSGEISSPEGAMPIVGAWAEEKLTFSFDYNGTPIAATSALKEGALAGEMNYGNGQSIMPFTAKKRATS